MIKTALDFLQIHQEVKFGNASVVIENMFTECPKAFDSVDMVLCASINEALGVVDGVVLAIPVERLIPLERIGVIDGALTGFGADMRHECLG